MGRRNYNNQHNQGISCGQIIIGTIFIAIMILSHVYDEKENENRRIAARSVKSSGKNDAVTIQIAGNSDEYMLQTFTAETAGNTYDARTGRSLIHILCELNRIEVLSKLLSDGAQINPRDNLNGTPMHSALRNNSSECVDLLLKHNADLKAVDSKNYSILHGAAEYGYYEVAKEALRAGASIDAKAYEYTPLQLASFKGHLRIVVLLCENGAEVVSRGPYGWTAGDMAFGKYPEIVKYLTTQNAAFSEGYLIDKYELKDGWPFFGDREILYLPDNNQAFIAVRDDSPEQLAELDRQMQELDITNKAGTPLLILAIGNNKSAAASYLVGYTKKINDADANGKNALMHALAVGNKDICRQLLTRGVKLDHLDSAGNSALHYAITRCDNDLVAELINKGADIFAVNYFSRGMMHAAAESSNEVIFPTLIANGCDVNQEDIRGNTALHLAAKANNTRILQALLTNGADFARRNLSGKQPVDLATSPEAAQLLGNRFEIEGENPANRALPAEVHTLTTPSSY